MDSTLETPVNAQPEAPVSSPQPSENKEQLKALLAEARNTKILLEDFQSAVLCGNYSGGQMLKIAKGLAFLDAILGQNKGHIKNLQERLGE